jgi:hypothetical protein
MNGILDELGQDVIPEVFSSLNSAGLTDTMTIKAESATTTDAAGRRVKGTTTDAYTNVPVTYRPMRQGRENYVAGDKTIDEQRYVLKFPTYHEGERINVNAATQRLYVDARGDEPAKVFRIIGVGDVQGVYYEVVCTKEG